MLSAFIKAHHRNEFVGVALLVVDVAKLLHYIADPGTGVYAAALQHHPHSCGEFVVVTDWV